MSNDLNDLWAVQVPGGELIDSAEHFVQTIVATSGETALMRTISPTSFVRLKRSIASDPRRDPLKRPKDALQAEIVDSLIDSLMPQWRTGTASNPETMNLLST